ncbi:MAG TPA: hypothetical protein VFR73_01095 [Hyphomicrobiaceae bacterium]|nr:hypothetical protein [Hyphomicrobiaceae bacterium]
MRIAERLLVCLAAIVAFGLSARAQEVPNLGREPQSRPQDTPDLLRQIDVELRRSYLKEGDVTCVASLLGDQWKSMSGGQCAPYQCRFGDRTLRIEAERTYFDARGKRLGRPGEMPDEALLNRAKSFRENNLRWGWTPEYAR